MKLRAPVLGGIVSVLFAGWALAASPGGDSGHEPSSVPVPPPPPPSGPPAGLPGLAGAPPSVDAPGDVPVLEAQSPHRPRPRFAFDVGMGVSFDDTGLIRARQALIPAFHGGFGMGDGAFGVEVRLLSTQAAGRFYERRMVGESFEFDQVVDRLIIEGLIAVRPFAFGQRRTDPSTGSFATRVLQSVTLNVGPGFERLTAGFISAFRPVAIAAAHVDIPLTPRSEVTELRLRLGMHRIFGPNRDLGGRASGDSTLELLTSVVAVF